MRYLLLLFIPILTSCLSTENAKKYVIDNKDRIEIVEGLKPWDAPVHTIKYDGFYYYEVTVVLVDSQTYYLVGWGDMKSPLYKWKKDIIMEVKADPNNKEDQEILKILKNG